jgi:Gpi18-like mannosyltransferase
LVGLFALLDEHYILGGISLALAVLIKPQPIIFVPLVLLFLWRWRGPRQFLRFTVAGAVTLVVFCLPILVPHFQVFDMLHNIQTQSYNASARLTSDAFNFWWLVGYSQESLDSTFMGINSGIVGDVLFAGVTLVCGYQTWRRREPTVLCFALAVQVFGFFMFMGGQHERYLFLFIPLMLACLIVSEHVGEEHLAALYILGTALSFLNMLVGVGGGLYASDQVLPFFSGSVLGDIVSAGFTSWALIIALAALVTFIYAVDMFVSGKYVPVPQSDQHKAHVAGRRT